MFKQCQHITNINDGTVAIINELVEITALQAIIYYHVIRMIFDQQHGQDINSKMRHDTYVADLV